MPRPSRASTAPRGAYGLRFLGLPDDDGLRAALLPASRSWPAVRIAVSAGTAANATGVAHVDDDRGEIPLPEGGRLVLDRGTATATLTGLGPQPYDVLVHPALAYVASVYAEWLGRHAVHAGAFLAGDGAWGVLGGHEAGKSSTLGWLAQAGHPVVADDMLVLDGMTVFAGPRSIDLRPATAGLPELRAATATVRDGSRRRFPLGPIPAAYPLRGWFVLTWGDEVEVRPISPGERLSALADHLHPANAAAKARVLDLLALPAFELSRPKVLSSLPDAAAKLVSVAEGRAGRAA